ncbi:MAG: RagB/SusD family nutrient uptake outer membrane protein [Bacteroidales bacterium]|nr:RagB/SusD family nutrient uptake outer membrane protein [Bacteroidales bacterium]
MKKIFASFLLASLALGSFVACESEKDFLTEKPKAQFSIDNAYQTSAQVLSTVVSAYASVGAINYGVTNAMQSDEMTYFSVFGAATSIINNWNNLGTWNGMNAKTVWDTDYQIIAYANQALYACGLESITWSSDAEKTAIKAEALCLRGYAYLRLGELFGGVPLVTEYSEDLRFDYQRASREDTYKQAIEDLTFAYQNLPEKPEIGRVGKGAAAIMLAEANLAAGDYDKAISFAQECYKIHPLMTKRFGVRADPKDTGMNLGVPNYNEEGTVYSDLFYKQNPRLKENTEAVWVLLSAKSFAEYSANSSVIRTMTHASYAPALRDVPALKADLQGDYKGKPWADGQFDNIYGVVNGRKTSIPAIMGAGVPFTGHPSWFACVQVWDDDHNKGADDRGKEGVAIRRKYPVTNKEHPNWNKQDNSKPYGAGSGWVGWEDLDKTNFNQSMEFFQIHDKRTPIDAWGYDENTYFSSGVFGARIFRDWYMYRSAEAYLIEAEAKLRKGDKNGAAAAVNVLRNRANATPFTADEMTLQVLLDERCRELMYEEDRWATFLRQEPETWKTRIWSYGMWSYDPAKGTLNKNAKLFPDTQQVNAANGGQSPALAWDLWPIPQTYVDLNTDNPEGMKQNPGW